MDIMFRSVGVISVEPEGSYPYTGLNVHLDDVDADDTFDSLCEKVNSDKFIDAFLMHHLSEMSDLQKEEILDKIGKNFIKGYFYLKEDDE